MKIHKDLKLNGTKCSKDVKLKMTDTLELSDKDFKQAIVKMLQQVRGNTSETNRKIDYISKEIRDIKEPNGNLDLFEQGEETIRNLEHRLTEIMQ